jgi:hypothetical protein
MKKRRYSRPQLDVNKKDMATAKMKRGWGTSELIKTSRKDLTKATGQLIFTL